MKTRKAQRICAAFLAVFVAIAVVGAGQAGDFPRKDLTGAITFNPGGSMDNVSRIVTPFAEKYLGKTIVLQNKPGAAGAVAMQYVFNSRPDGYTLLYSAENANIYKILNISQIDYDMFEPVILMANAVAIIVVNADSKYKTYQDLIDDARANPETVRAGTNGPGSGGEVSKALMTSVEKVTINSVPFDSEGASITAILGNHVETTGVGLSSAMEFIKAGKVRALAVIAKERVASLPDVPSVAELNGDYGKFLPWGPFYGVYVKKETPPEVLSVLKDAFMKAYEEKEFQNLVEQMGIIPLGITGDEAKQYIKHVQSISSWLIYEAGGAEKSPAEFGIEKIE